MARQMTEQEAFAAFDWRKVCDYMAEKPRWKWYKYGLPAVEELRFVAMQLVNEVVRHNLDSCYSGGLKVTRQGEEWTLSFAQKKATKKSAPFESVTWVNFRVSAGEEMTPVITVNR